MVFYPDVPPPKPKRSNSRPGDNRANGSRHLPARGWLPDPSETHLERFWDGSRWTIRTRNRATKVENPPPASAAYQPRDWTPSPPRRRFRAGRVLSLTVLIVIGLVAAYQYIEPRDGAPAMDLLADPLAHAPAQAVPDVEPAAAIELPVTPQTHYATFGSTELVSYLEASMIVQRDSIDVSWWVQSMEVEEVLDALLEAESQSPYIFVEGWEAQQVGTNVTVRPAYHYGDVEAERRRAATLEYAADALVASGANVAISATDKVTRIHDFVVGFAEYDRGAFDAINAGDSSPRVHQSQEAYGILAMGTAVCNGYAKAFSAIAKQAGLDVVTVTGSDSSGATGGSHAWNKVLVDGRWLLVDTTWDDPLGWEGEPRHDYLLIPDDDPILSTRVVGTDWVVDENLGAFAS